MTDTRTHANIKSAPVIRAYLGGSFNPVHNGHIQMAMQVYNQLLPLAEQQQRSLHVSLLPNARSPFKQKTIVPKHRLAMLELAVQNTPLQICELELWQAPPVYTIDSVQTLRTRYPNDSLIFIMGMDSAQTLDKWKDGLQLTDYVHLWIFNRLDNQQNFSVQALASLASRLPNNLQRLTTDSPADLTATLLKTGAQGSIYIDPRAVAAISSTQIRQQLQAQITPNIANNLAKCLNPLVYHYIISHQLYSSAQFR